MKLIHLSDLHLGKRVNEFSMLEDQAYILAEILRIIDEELPDPGRIRDVMAAVGMPLTPQDIGISKEEKNDSQKTAIRLRTA